MFKFAAIGAALALTAAGAAGATEPIASLPDAELVMEPIAPLPDAELGPEPMAPLPDAELEEHRGGFIMIDGLTLDFSAVVESYVGGQMVLRSTLTWTPQGAVATHAGTAAETATPEALAALAAAGIVLSPEMLSDGGLYVSADGQSAFVHRVSGGSVANLLVNVGDGREFYQQTSITLNLPGFDAAQTGMREALALRALVSEIQASLAPAY